MDEDEEFKTKEHNSDSKKALPAIHKKKSNQFFQLDEVNSGDKINGSNSNVVSSSNNVSVGKTKENHMRKTSDKIKDIEDVNSHPNGTVTGSDHKLFAKYTGRKSITKNDETPISHDKSSAAENEVIVKERRKCPK